jgi:hypothetical protein
MIVGALALGFSSVALAYGVTCPIDGSSTYFTGQTKIDVTGKLLQLHKCLQFGHEVWVVQ